MSSTQSFPSGPWIGFYTYNGNAKKFLMDLVLEFRQGAISGDGADGVGFFRIYGSYDDAKMECLWDKTYVGRHTVSYTGFREGKGIWGTWTLATRKGGFHIWPLSEGAPLDARKNEEEEPAQQPLLLGGG